MSEEERLTRRQHHERAAAKRAAKALLQKSDDGGEVVAEDDRKDIKEGRKSPAREHDVKSVRRNCTPPNDEDIQTYHDVKEKRAGAEGESVANADACEEGGEAKESAANNTNADSGDAKNGGEARTIEQQIVKIESTEGDKKDQTTTDECDIGYRERHAAAIAKIMAKKWPEKDEKKSSIFGGIQIVPSALTIYLILTSSPGSPRLKISIPKDITAVSLRERASKASKMPEPGMRLIFRGRLITEQTSSTGRSVVDEFSIEHGSALHVVGRPRQPNNSIRQFLGQMRRSAESSFDAVRGIVEGNQEPDIRTPLSEEEWAMLRPFLASASLSRSGEGYQNNN